jgi:hypothetical protein
LCGAAHLRAAVRRERAAPVARAGHLSGQPEVESSLRGKSIRLLDGTTPGAGYDLRAAAGGAYGSHIPGNPARGREHEPGRQPRLAMNYLYNARRGRHR